MSPIRSQLEQTRRSFLATSASGLGGVALASLLTEDGLLADESANPLIPRRPHYEPKAKACINIFMAGAPSHLDLFDPKPELNKRHGQSLPKDVLDKARFAFIKPDTVKLMGTKRVFKPYGQCGMELSDYLPHLGTVADELLMVRSMQSDEFNHHPGQLLMQCGVSRFGMPTTGSWINYGLGSSSNNLPGYIVLTAGRGSSGGATLWQSGFLPSTYEGVLFRSKGEPVLNLANPKGLPPQLQRAGLQTLRDVNRGRYEKIYDPEIASRIASYELASRMQTAAPELIDLSGENVSTLKNYGVDRKDPGGGGRGKSGNTQQDFARNCLLARRMVERGVRFINIIYASWDHHSQLDKELKYNAHVVDQPIAALIRDLKQRGLLDSTLVQWSSEFGRTPLGENRGNNENATGRDHHPFCFSMLMAGGGIRGGQIYGATDEIGWSVAENPVHPNDLHATLLHCFGLDHKRLTYRFQGRDFRLTDVAGRVIKDWLA
ncbi:MAG TPA: sulfatase [Verrucomicrobiales bacterium]|nr:sulfatase [Verrucomicrobiales bacterium]